MNDKFKGAFEAWSLAIKSKLLLNNQEESIEDLAKQFGKRITDEDHLVRVEQWFDWDNIRKDLKSFGR